jgi:hypothetical protein
MAAASTMCVWAPSSPQINGQSCIILLRDYLRIYTSSGWAEYTSESDVIVNLLPGPRGERTRHNWMAVSSSGAPSESLPLSIWAGCCPFPLFSFTWIVVAELSHPVF